MFKTSATKFCVCTELCLCKHCLYLNTIKLPSEGELTHPLRGGKKLYFIIFNEPKFSTLFLLNRVIRQGFKLLNQKEERENFSHCNS